MPENKTQKPTSKGNNPPPKPDPPKPPPDPRITATVKDKTFGLNIVSSEDIKPFIHTEKPPDSKE